MSIKRAYHACALRDNMVYVVGGNDLYQSKHGMEIWDGYRWSGPFTTRVGGNHVELLLQGRNLYVFGVTVSNVVEHLLTDEIWKIDQRNNLIFYDRIKKARNNVVRLTIPYNFLTNCKGLYLKIKHSLIKIFKKKRIIKFLTQQTIFIAPVSISGVKCGTFGTSKSCRHCPTIYSKESCTEDCGYMFNSSSKSYECRIRGK